MTKYVIKSGEWEKIFPILAAERVIYAKNELKTKRFFEAIHYLALEGCRWRALPRWYGKWRAVHKRYLEWCKKGIFDMLFAYFSKDFDGEYIMIDSTIVRAHPFAGGSQRIDGKCSGLGRSKGGFTTKIHAVVDALGLPLRLLLSAGQRHDIVYAEQLLKGFEGANVIGDKGYDSNKLINALQEQKCTIVIPSKRNRKIPRNIDRHIYKERHLVEIFFRKLKNFRRVFSRFDKEIVAYQGFVTFVSILMWLK